MVVGSFDFLLHTHCMEVQEVWFCYLCSVLNIDLVGELEKVDLGILEGYVDIGKGCGKESQDTSGS